MSSRQPARALSIAGSDSGGGAGIQADLKTFAAMGVYGMSALTAVTAQNSVEVRRILTLPSELVGAQIDAVMEDLGANAVKTGMLASSEIIRIVANRMAAHAVSSLVVDPVMISTSGSRLIQEEAIQVMKERLFNLATIVTPNLSEAEVLVGYSIENEADLLRAARQIVATGAGAVVIKGGHDSDPDWSNDIVFDGEDFFPLKALRVKTRNTHGSGCTFAAAITAGLAKGLSLKEACSLAKEYVTEAIQHSFSLGKGAGPLGHFY